ncbi:hypothetical protein BpHYR1_051253 [Brachionus plicatilis]|uniref:HAT C-terminal dimerisation domain-containing protein n=1 Tax=Brachionus plicatilis TaxID=10195 RepID=A0A3M7T973_BRAPC|nr:hypothetical protein BpHYR1_051253 [Brachionus plicatilis]
MLLFNVFDSVITNNKQNKKNLTDGSVSFLLGEAAASSSPSERLFSLTSYQAWDRRNKISPERVDYTGLFTKLLDCYNSDRSPSDGRTRRPLHQETCGARLDNGKIV